MPTLGIAARAAACGLTLLLAA
ncbi:MAG: hypothetical protein JWR80_5669, partial [Bradyrhizobium sp.]|nr:hypothetical protein [Bradyrhizobium sp.]